MHKISVRSLSDTSEWNYILTQADADDFMKMFAGFHDSTLEKINYSESNSSTMVNAIFDNSGWFGIVELCFEGIQPAPSSGNDPVWLCSSLNN